MRVRVYDNMGVGTGKRKKVTDMNARWRQLITLELKNQVSFVDQGTKTHSA